MSHGILISIFPRSWHINCRNANCHNFVKNQLVYIIFVSKVWFSGTLNPFTGLKAIWSIANDTKVKMAANSDSKIVHDSISTETQLLVLPWTSQNPRSLTLIYVLSEDVKSNRLLPLIWELSASIIVVLTYSAHCVWGPQLLETAERLIITIEPYHLENRFWCLYLGLDCQGKRLNNNQSCMTIPN